MASQNREREIYAKLSSASPGELRTYLAAPPSEDLPVLRAIFGDNQLQQVLKEARSASSRALFSSRGNVVLLHGIMGGELSSKGFLFPHLLWLNPLRLIAGEFLQLGVDPQTGLSRNDIIPTGLIPYFYTLAKLRLSINWDVEVLPFDWRLDIRTSAHALAQAIYRRFGASSPVHLVAHSMGGLVARQFIKLYPDRWSKGGRLVMLGTPNRGSFASPRALFGDNDILELVSKLSSLAHNKSDLLRVIQTFSGLIQMMPSLEVNPAFAPLYQLSTYPQAGLHQSMLDDARAFHAELAGIAQPERLVYIAGSNQSTIDGIADPNRLAEAAGYTMSVKGDGTVPHSLGLLPGVKTYYIEESHQNLLTNHAAIDATLSILESGTCQLSESPILSRANAASDEVERMDRASKRVEALSTSLRSVGLRSLDSTVSAEEQELIRIIVSGGRELDRKTDSSSGPTGTTSTPNDLITVAINFAAQDIALFPGSERKFTPPPDIIASGYYPTLRLLGSTGALAQSVSGDDGEPLFEDLRARGILPGGLGQVFFYPDPRPGSKMTIALVSMADADSFGISELILYSRQLIWACGRAGRLHVATALTGAGRSNLSASDAAYAWLTGIARALRLLPAHQRPRAITFIVRPESSSGSNPSPSLIPSALRSHSRDIGGQFNIEFQLDSTIESSSKLQPRTFSAQPLEPTRLTIELKDETARFTLQGEGATNAVREYRIKASRYSELNRRLLEESDPHRKRRLGQILWDYLIPRDIRNKIGGDQPLVFALNNEASRIYWELASPLTVLEDPLSESSRHIGLLRGFSRQLNSTVAPVSGAFNSNSKIRILIVADPSLENPLPGAAAEGSTLHQFFQNLESETTGFPRVEVTLLSGAQANLIDVLMEINSQPPYDILHYAGHCAFNPQDPTRSGFLFSNGDVLSALDLDRIDRVPRFVFANACESGLLPSRMDKSSPDITHNFAEAFFKQGVQGYIATAWPVEDRPALDFACEFYRQLFSLGAGGVAIPISHALLSARKVIQGTASWAAYQHYGDPNFRILRQDSPQVRSRAIKSAPKRSKR